NGAYDALQSVDYYGREFVVMADIEANLAYLSIANSNRFVSAYTYTWTVQNGDIAGVWNAGYRAILRVNNVINGIDELEGDAARRNQIKGEALAIRALCYFDLVRFFAKPYATGTPSSDLGVPITLEATLEELPRNTVAEVYNQVISDLTTAKSLMTADSRTRMNALAAEALLARVYLYQEDFTNAEASASEVINSGEFALIDNFSNLYLSDSSSEDIFTLRFLTVETRGSDNMGQIYNPEGYGDIRVTQDLIDLYEPNDQRNLIYQLSANNEYYTSKYAGQDGTIGLVSPRILRLGEMYLIRAEARFRTNDDAGALEDLNTLRAARDASALSSIPNFRTILEERQRELVFEGHTTFDYWRNGITMVRSQCNTGLEVNLTSCSVNASDFRTVHPIPDDEVLVNQNMVQNDGY
ncbi:MAG: RagB/SusD family nutrient uptake outer membrane protein, partial [Saprospiraceae bacterium]|nr:RagB/SusD family nutrient uptake outer membrane protein [Bacteroidia bacterium]NNL90999.1 RagB/SusD family nutrient uptake outer membrane protein [Saprospiraceae bacterium]